MEQQSHLLSFWVCVEVIWPDIFAKHHVIIEINELLGEPWDAVDVGLNGRGAKSGEVAVILEDILQVKEKHTDKHVKENQTYDRIADISDRCCHRFSVI